MASSSFGPDAVGIGGEVEKCLEYIQRVTLELSYTSKPYSTVNAPYEI